MWYFEKKNSYILSGAMSKGIVLATWEVLEKEMVLDIIIKL